MQTGRPSRIPAMLASAIALLLTGCALLPTNPTITVKNDECSYSGPADVPEQVSVNWDIETRSSLEAFTFIFATLGPGKTKADILALKGIDLLAPQASWYKPIHFTTMVGGQSSEQINLGPDIVDRLEPIYILCVGVKGLIGVVGPIEVEPR